jgi:hypothetical protein
MLHCQCYLENTALVLALLAIADPQALIIITISNNVLLRLVVYYSGC